MISRACLCGPIHTCQHPCRAGLLRINRIILQALCSTEVHTQIQQAYTLTLQETLEKAIERELVPWDLPGREFTEEGLTEASLCGWAYWSHPYSLCTSGGLSVRQVARLQAAWPPDQRLLNSCEDPGKWFRINIVGSSSGRAQQHSYGVRAPTPQISLWQHGACWRGWVDLCGDF